MKLLLNVDQAQALRDGIDAPQSTVSLEVNPSDLTDLEREVVAAVLYHGHDCTVCGICREGDKIKAPFVDDRDGRSHGNGHPTRPLRLVRPDLVGLKAAIQDLLDERDLYRAEQADKQLKRQKEADAYVDATLAAVPETHEIAVVLGKSGNPREESYPGSQAHVRIEVPCVPDQYKVRYASPARQERFAAARDEIDRLIARAISDTRPELERLTAEHEAEIAAERVDYDALYARLPEALRERNAAGFAGEDEVSHALRQLIRKDAGYSDFSGWERSSSIDALSDTEYEIFRRAEAEAPEGASVEAREVWDVGYRQAEDHEYDEADEDGEIIIRENERNLVVIKWSVGGIKNTAVVSLR